MTAFGVSLSQKNQLTVFSNVCYSLWLVLLPRGYFAANCYSATIEYNVTWGEKVHTISLAGGAQGALKVPWRFPGGGRVRGVVLVPSKG